MYKILLEFAVYDNESINYYLIDKWESCYPSLLFVYNDTIVKEKYINILKYIKNVSYTQIYIDITEEELFYLKLKYPKEMGIIEYCNMIISV